MQRYYRCCWFDPNAASPDVPGHPLYVHPRQGAGRVDDPEHEYLVRYVATDEVGCVAEAFGDFAVWTPALLVAPPRLPDAYRAIVEYVVAATVCDLDDPKQLAEFDLRPSDVVTPDRARSQRWARQIYETGQFDGVSWWSRRDARWTCTALWRAERIDVARVTILTSLSAPAVAEAARVLLRRVGR